MVGYKTISHKTESYALKIIDEFTESIENINIKALCIITDKWPNSVNKNTFIDYSISMNSERFNKKYFQLNMEYFPQPKTSINLF